ncbi:MAG: hypothetical protein HY820_25165 [Acidobacteria bacterium]|nr:hypothetical protein [Acidobacteriota bacterium]
MDAMELYHRSFLDVTNNARTKHNMFVGKETYERQAVANSVPGYQWLPKAFRPIDLFAKAGQNFKLRCTSWEERCSTLIGPGLAGHTRMQPVVDQRGTPAGLPVIAHYGVVDGQHIIAPSQYVRQGDPQLMVQKLLEQDIPVFVTSGQYPNAGAWSSITDMGIYRFTLLTDLEGRVIAEFGSHLKDDSIVSVDPFALLAVGSLIVSLGKGVGERLILAMTRKSAQKQATRTLTAIEKAKKNWGQAEVLDGGAKGAASTIEIARQTMQRAMPQIVDQATNKIAFKTFQQFHNAMQKAGFKVIKVEKFGPDGGYQVFYQNGNVVGRFKTLGDAGGPRMGQTHISFSLTDGKGLQWMNDMAKFNANGKLAPKNIVDPKKFDPAKDFQGNPHRFPVVDSKFDIKVVDSWANSTHFNTPAGFDLRGVGDVVRRITP